MISWIESVSLPKIFVFPPPSWLWHVPITKGYRFLAPISKPTTINRANREVMEHYDKVKGSKTQHSQYYSTANFTDGVCQASWLFRLGRENREASQLCYIPAVPGGFCQLLQSEAVFRVQGNQASGLACELEWYFSPKTTWRMGTSVGCYIKIGS